MVYFVEYTIIRLCDYTIIRLCDYAIIRLYDYTVIWLYGYLHPRILVSPHPRFSDFNSFPKRRNVGLGEAGVGEVLGVDGACRVFAVDNEEFLHVLFLLAR